MADLQWPQLLKRLRASEQQDPEQLLTKAHTRRAAAYGINLQPDVGVSNSSPTIIECSGGEIAILNAD